MPKPRSNSTDGTTTQYRTSKTGARKVPSGPLESRERGRLAPQTPLPTFPFKTSSSVDPWEEERNLHIPRGRGGVRPTRPRS